MKLFGRKSGKAGRVRRRYGVSAFCKNCMYYVGRKHGKLSLYCMKHGKHVSPYGYCDDFITYEAFVRKQNKEVK